MSIESENSDSFENYEKYFCHFGHKLYDSPFNSQEIYPNFFPEKNDLTDNSSTNYSNNSQKGSDDEDEEKYIPFNLLNTTPSKQTSTENNKEINPELEKFILPKSLFTKTTKIIPEKNDTSLTYKLNLESEPFVPKKKLFPENSEAELCFNYLFDCYKGAAVQAENYFKNADKKIKNVDKKKKKKHKEFVEREGDWSCYRCKNLNFGFRTKCNKCGFTKEESEKKFIEVGEQLSKLADLSVYEKKTK